MADCDWPMVRSGISDADCSGFWDSDWAGRPHVGTASNQTKPNETIQAVHAIVHVWYYENVTLQEVDMNPVIIEHGFNLSPTPSCCRCLMQHLLWPILIYQKLSPSLHLMHHQLSATQLFRWLSAKQHGLGLFFKHCVAQNSAHTPISFTNSGLDIMAQSTLVIATCEVTNYAELLVSPDS